MFAKTKRMLVPEPISEDSRSLECLHPIILCADVHFHVSPLKLAELLYVLGRRTCFAIRWHSKSFPVRLDCSRWQAGRWGSKKKVTLLTSHPTLLERMHKDVGVAAEKWLVSKGVHLVFNQRVDAAKSSSHEVVTESGLSIKADLVYSCMGFKPNALPLRQHYPGALTEHGGVKVNEFLQVEVRVMNQHVTGTLGLIALLLPWTG